MNYFEMFPTMAINIGTNSVPDFKAVLDITRRVKVKDAIMSNAVFYDYYLIQNGESPETLSDRFYNTPFYHWVILIANNIVDMKAEWPLSEDVFDRYVANKYTGITNTHHYENASGLIVDAGSEGALPVTNYDYELGINNKKRLIRLVKPEMLDSIIEQFETALTA